MSFNRHQEQCAKCSCYFENADGEVKELMDKHQLECTHEMNCWMNKPCDLFYLFEKEESEP